MCFDDVSQMFHCAILSVFVFFILLVSYFGHSLSTLGLIYLGLGHLGHGLSLSSKEMQVRF